MRSYSFRVVLEEGTFPDGAKGYFVSVPALEHLGAATQGRTREEALKNIEDVLEMILEELQQEGKRIPDQAAMVSEGPMVTVTL